MSDTDLLTEQLHHLTDRAPVPSVPTTDDVRRGRGRLRRRRLGAAAGTAALAVAVGGVALATGTGADRAHPTDRAAPAAPAAQPPAAPREQAPPVRIGGVRVGDVGPGEITVAELQALSRAVDGAFGDRRYPRMAIGHAPTWRAAGGATCATGWTCERLDVDGARRARSATDGTSAQVMAQFPSGVVILTFTDAGGLPPALGNGGAGGS